MENYQNWPGSESETIEEMGLFGKSKPADPKALVDEWSKKVRKEGYGLDRQIRQIQRQEQLAIKSIKDATKKGKLFMICLFRLPVLHLTGCHISTSMKNFLQFSKTKRPNKLAMYLSVPSDLET